MYLKNLPKNKPAEYIEIVYMYNVLFWVNIVLFNWEKIKLVIILPLLSTYVFYTSIL